MPKMGLASKAGDIRVIGLVAGTHVIEDIGRDVPHGVTVTIPGELAVRSKDLWRAISQKCIFQLPTVSPPQAVISEQEKEALEQKVLILSAQVKMLEIQNKTLREKLQTEESSYNKKLDSIIFALQNMTIQNVMVRTVEKPSSEVDGSAPMFIPKEISPKDAVARIDVSGKESPSDVSEVVEKLRKLRKDSGD